MTTQVIKWARKCSECGSGMNAGFVVAQGEDYYCSDHCLHKHFTPEEWKHECSVPDSWFVGDWSYYTEWDVEDDSEINWIEVDGKIILNPDNK